MASPFVKAWRYLMALFGAKVDQYADPKVQIQQAIEESQKQHQALVQQAAAVIGNQRQLEMKLSRQLSEVERLQASARQALTVAAKTRDDGDQKKADEYEKAAQVFATQLVSVEQGIDDLKKLHDQAIGAAARARKAVEDNAMMLKQKLAERTKLLNQLEQARMQERIATSLESMSELAAPGNVPSLDEVREKIERRYAAALGRADLAENSVEGRLIEVERSALDMAGANRLDQIRANMAADKLEAAPERNAVEAGTPQPDPGATRLDEIRATLGKERNSDTPAS